MSGLGETEAAAEHRHEKGARQGITRRADGEQTFDLLQAENP
jgi:hypothetical protein